MKKMGEVFLRPWFGRGRLNWDAGHNVNKAASDVEQFLDLDSWISDALL